MKPVALDFIWDNYKLLKLCPFVKLERILKTVDATCASQRFHFILYSMRDKRISIYSLKKRNKILRAPWTSRSQRVFQYGQLNVFLPPSLEFICPHIPQVLLV